MVCWAAVTIITVVKTGAVPTELWTIPGAGIGAVMALFRNSEDDEEEDTAVANQEAQKELPS